MNDGWRRPVRSAGLAVDGGHGYTTANTTRWLARDGDEPAAGRTQGPAWGVAALLLALRDALAARFGSVTVQGELSALARPGSGHLYFTLKDAEGAPAAIRAVMWRSTASQLSFAPRDGQQVRIRGRLALYEARGDLQLLVESMTPAGEGTLYEQFLQLKAKLEAQGLFDAARRMAIDPHPRALAVVTSLGAAALHDVLAALARRAPHVPVTIHPCLVQGSSAPPAIVQALQAAERQEPTTILLVRGGGSLEDLWAFNDERVVRAVDASTVPIICGVGHESDVTLADLAADLRAPTPTAAAELAAEPRERLLQAVQLLADRLRDRVARRLDQQAQRLDLLARRARLPSQILRGHEARLDALDARRRAALQRRLDAQQARIVAMHDALRRAVADAPRVRAGRLDVLAARLAAVDPDQVLARGYARIASMDGTPVVSTAQLAPRQELRLHLRDGSADAVVEQVNPSASLRG